MFMKKNCSICTCKVQNQSFYCCCVFRCSCSTEAAQHLSTNVKLFFLLFMTTDHCGFVPCAYLGYTLLNKNTHLPCCFFIVHRTVSFLAAEFPLIALCPLSSFKKKKTALVGEILVNWVTLAANVCSHGSRHLY